MPTFLFGTLVCLSPESVGLDIVSSNARYSLLLLIAICTFIFPSITVFYLYRAGYVSSIRLENLSDRRLPYFATATIYGITSYFFGIKMVQVSNLPPEIGIILATITLSILSVGIISLWWQISAHAVGVSGIVGILLAIIIQNSTESLHYPFLLSILVWGWVVSARLSLNAHTTAQVTAGSVLGFIISFVASYWFL
jgi:hypothetical protein